MRNGNRVLQYLLTVPAFTLMLSASSCSLHRGAAPDMTATGAAGPGAAAGAEELPGICRPEDCFGSALALLRSGDAYAGRLRLTELADMYPDTVWAARASYLLAGYAIEEGSREALALLDDAGSLTDIGDYILFNRALAFKNLGLLDASLAAYDSIPVLYPDSPLNSEAPFRKASALMEAGFYARARTVFSAFIKDHPESALVPEALLDIAISSVVLDEKAEAAKAANRILHTYPAHPTAKYAVALVLELKHSIEVPELTLEERFRRAERLFSHARYKEAIAEYSYLSENAGERDRQRSTLNLAVSEARLKRYDLAEKALKAYLKSRDPEKEREALYWLALAAARQGKEDLLNDSVRDLSIKYPKSTERARALLLLANLYSGRGFKDKAASVLRQVAGEFKNTEAADEALWSIGWSAYRAGRYSEALKTFISYGETNPKGRQRGQFLYWSGRSLEKTGRKKEAAFEYNRVCASGPAYYCQTARGRLDMINGGRTEAFAPFNREDPWAAGPDPAGLEAQKNEDPYGDGALALVNDGTAEDAESGLSLDTRYLAARELLILGLDNLASKELSVLTKSYPDDPEALVELAGLFYQAGDYYGSMRIYYRYLSNVDPDERTDAATELRAYSFPPGIVESVRLKAPEGADPYLVAAVMREESSYNPGAVSVTGALGLMQIMPSTGRFVARELGRADFEPRELLNPETNISMGSWYLDYLSKKFNKDIVLTIAGYNAGPGAVRKWVETLPPEFDEFIESIPYTETRNYAKKVLKSYSEFRRASAAPQRQGAIRAGALLRKGTPASSESGARSVKGRS
ncbi:MAG: transglycosylase SLT domain-containing protein [Deltaproteobacteria bacterium]|nr:transglycosylase SLT domain-containing protein [Deltaproteobacteria bacterium]